MAEASTSRSASYPARLSSPSVSTTRFEGEEYELNSPPPPKSASLPSARRPSRARGYSIQSLSSHPHGLLFDNLTSPVLRRPHLPKVNFTTEDDEEVVRIRSSNILAGLGAEDESTWEIARGMKSSFRRKVFLLMEEPKSSDEAFFIHWTSTFLILFSALLTVISTLPGYHSVPVLARVLFGLDTTIVVLFTIEYIARLVGHSDTAKQLWRHSTSFLAIIDFLSVFPYYLEILFHADTSVLFRFSILRTFRLLRVFRAFRYSNTVILTIEVMRISIKLSQDALLALGFFIIMVLIVFSTLIYFAERGSWDDVLQTFVNADGDATSFGSIPAAAWFVLVTITTVGYGEITPRSTLGRLVTVPLLIFGLLLIALPSFVLGRNFASVWEAVRHSEFDQGSFFHTPGGDPSSLSDPSYSPRRSQEGLLDPEAAASRPPQHSSRDPTPLPTTNSSANGRATSPASYEENGGGNGLRTLPMGSPGVSKHHLRDPSGPAEGRSGVDLSNLKLARNQEALSGQIDALRETVESQGRLVERLLAALEAEETVKSRGGKGKKKSTGDGTGGGEI